MTSWACTSYLVRYLKQFGYIKQRKIHNGKVQRHKKSFFIPIGLHSVTNSKDIDYNQYKQFHKKKREKIEGKGERENEKRKEREKKRAEEGGKKKRKEKERKEQRKKAKRKEKEREEVEKRIRRKGMEGVFGEGKEKGRMRGGKKEEKKEKEKK